MDVRSPLNRAIARILIGVMLFDPVKALAADLAVDAAAGGNTSIGQAGNGVPVVNIATPNGSGLSHNKFTDYNVGQQGLILNNGAQAFVPSQLGGYINGNPNLQGGAAGVILNEVTGSNRSQLKGYTEVAGQAAHVIVANPHGITCDGCGFINTPRATLSTGAPQIQDGRLKGFDVDGGDIAIEGAGLNASNVDQFDLITRTAKINAEIHAKRLNVIAGRNEVDVATLQATAKADDGSEKPQVAIDSSALGGMYAGAIRLVGTEAGVGVKLAGDMAATAGDIQIDAGGQLTMNRSAASGNTTLVADNVDLKGDTYAGGTARVEARQVDVRESLAAGEQVKVQAERLNNAGAIEAGVRADGSTNSAGHLQLDGGSVRNGGQLVSHGSLNTDLQKLDNADGQIAAAGSATLKAKELDNQKGQVVAQGNLTLDTDTLDNRQGSALAGQAMVVNAQAVDNRAGTLAAGGTITAKASNALNNDGGLVEAGGHLDMQADSLSNAGGRLRALGSGGESRFAIGTALNNDGGVLEVASAALTFDTPALSNKGGVVRHLGSAGLNLDMDLLGQAGGEFITNSAVSLSAEEWVNNSLLQAASITLDIDRLTQTAGGGLLAVNSLSTTGESWINDGRIETNGNLDLRLSGDYRGNGSLLALGNLDLQAGNIGFGADAQVRSGGYGRLSALGELISQGRMTAGAWLSMAAQKIDNRGTLGAGGALLLKATEAQNEGGLLFSGASMQLLADRFVNRLGDVYSFGDLLIAKDAQGTQADLIENRSGTLESEGDMYLRAREVANRKDAFRLDKQQTYGHISITCHDCKGDHHYVDYTATERFNTVVGEDSAAGRIHSGGNLDIRGEVVKNSHSSMTATNNILIKSDTLENVGAVTSDVERVRIYQLYGVTDGTDYRTRAAYIYPYNAAAFPKTVPEVMFNGPSSDVETTTTTGTVAPALIQAGGKVLIEAAQNLVNASVVDNQAPQAGAGQSLDTQVVTGLDPLRVLNTNLPPDLAQQAVNPIELPAFALPTGQNGLFSLSTNPAHPYLIETNPAFANLGNFINSDYLLGQLGYNPDEMQRRLGDGFYEQRLIREAVITRTGQRLLAGLNSDEAQYRYLMDNAVASKEALNLSVGVALSAEQVAALTHDIVWMQEQVVQGQKVLVPVLYLAQANGRLAPNGALIQGRDLALMSGSDLQSSGTLRASNNLDVSSRNIGNSGLVEANQRLQLLATESIRNAKSGVIAGNDVALQVGTDIINERSVQQERRESRNFSNMNTVAGQASRIEADNDLSLVAGRDIRNLGSVLSAGGTAELNAGRDAQLLSAQEDHAYQLQARRLRTNSSSTIQHGSEVQAGGDLQISAGQDISVVASRLNAGNTLEAKTGRDLLISSAANESHSFSKTKKVTQSRDQVTQQSSVLQAGQNVRLSAGNDLGLIASRVKAGENVALDAGQDTQILSAMDESASYYFKKKKGSFGRSKTTQSESYDSTNVASVIDAGNDLTLNTSKAADGSLNLEGGRDVTVIGSQLTAGNDLLVGGTGDVAVLSGVEEHGSYTKKSKSGFLGLSKSGKSQLKTSATQVGSELESGNDVVIAAGNDIRMRASSTDAGNDVELRSGLVKESGDINLVAANDEAYSRSESYKKKFGLSGGDAVGLVVGTPSWGGDIAISNAKKSGQEIIRSTNVGSQVNAERDASLIAERDVNVVGSGVSAGRNVLLDAGRDVNVAAGSSSEQVTSWKNTKTVGLQQSADGNGFTTFVGAESLKDKTRTSEQTAAASQISAGLDLDVRAGRDIRQQGSDMQAGYDLNMKAGRDIVVDAAREQSSIEREQSQKRSGTSTTVSHNFERTKDAVSGAGKGENTVSQASSILKAVDGVSQFLSGPTFDGHIGSSSQSQRASQTQVSNRGSNLLAGNDINLEAGDDISIDGSRLQTGRDINIDATNVSLGVARGEYAVDSEQNVGKGGIKGGTSGGFKLGVGASAGAATQEGRQGTSSPSELLAGRDINLDARNDLTLIGTRAQSGRDVNLNAGNDLLIGAAQNQSITDNDRRNAGGEVGVTVGSEGFGFYVSASLGKGRLDREGEQMQNAYLYAGRDLNFASGRDTSITGAHVEGENVNGEVGRNLTVSSIPDTGKASGKEYDVSATVTIGYGVSVSGSAGFGETSGKTDWVNDQTRVVARDKLDVRTGQHTQLDGALIASKTDNLKLDTDTLGFRDIKGEDRERSYYLNVGGSYGQGQQDKSQVGKGEEGQTGWSVDGYEYEREREQTVRATIGKGEIAVRQDAETGNDSTAGLNRDLANAYEINKDKESRTDLYVTKSSIEAVSKPTATVKEWAEALTTYDETAAENFEQIGIGLNVSYNRLEKALGRRLPAGAELAGGAAIAEGALEALLLSGMKLKDAKALLGSEEFQEKILAQLKAIDSISPEAFDRAGEVVIGPLEINGKPSDGSSQNHPDGQLTPAQDVLRMVSTMNEYLEKYPEGTTALSWAAAGLQGPKGIVQLAVLTALGETEAGQSVTQYLSALEDWAGRKVAESVEDKPLDESVPPELFLLGGGTLAAAIVLGNVSGKGKKSDSPSSEATSTNHNPHSGATDAQAGYPLPDRPVKGSEKGSDSFPDGINFRLNQPEHLAKVDGYSQRKGIGGAHNMDAFNQAVADYGVKIVDQTSGGVSGIVHIRYQVPAKDRAGNIVGYRTEILEKTVYDPKVYSDKKIIELGQQAASNGYQAAMAAGKREYMAMANGVKFQVYLDRNTGTVTNFFPVVK
ncbi:hemagglutinin repeat-containing protein [Pseudomonas sp. WHRI 8822A]|uniref:hemagglutinin repeat-containing protein n=1 Tax=Pseudomonas sp. WHRI 8822A TaxID=3162568 RepID=UPI0032EADC2B